MINRHGTTVRNPKQSLGILWHGIPIGATGMNPLRQPTDRTSFSQTTEQYA